MTKKFTFLFTAAFALCTVAMNAQTTAKTTTGAAAPASAQTKAPKLTEKDMLMVDKNWSVVSVEEWGVLTKPPGEKNKTDMLKLSAGGQFDMVMFGVKHTGTWTKAGQYIYFTDQDKKKISFKVLLQEAGKLKVDHYSDEEGHSIFEYEVK